MKVKSGEGHDAAGREEGMIAHAVCLIERFEHRTIIDMVLKAIRQDLQAVFDRDPAATSRLEVVLTYAGFHALLAYRVPIG